MESLIEAMKQHNDLLRNLRDLLATATDVQQSTLSSLEEVKDVLKGGE